MKFKNLFLLISALMTLPSCDFINDLINIVEESDIEDNKDKKEENKEENKEDNEEENKEDNEEENKEDNEEENKEEKVIELDYRGLTDISAFSNEYTLSLDDAFTNYDVSYEFENEDDSSFFSVTKKDSSFVIKALKESRHTYLNIIYKEKGKTKEVKRDKITLLSNSTNCGLTSFTSTKLGNKSIEENKYAQYKLKSSSIFGSANRTNDIVIPSKVKYEGNIKVVGSLSFERADFYCRDLFIPSTIFHIGSGTFAWTRCFGYLDIRQSDLGFLFMEKNSIIDNLTSYFLLEEAYGNNSQSRFFAGPNYYNFPYTKATYNFETSWDSAEYTPWDWQTNYVEVYKNKGDYESLRYRLRDNNYYFCN